MLPTLATPQDAAEFGLDVSEGALLRASARVRGHLRQRVTSGTSTITARGPAFRLPERPVVSVESVTDADGAAVEWELSGSLLTVDSIGRVTVTYAHGYASLPDELVELVCQIAARMDAAPASSALSQGVQQQTAGPFMVGYGWDAYKATAGLQAGERETLARYWPTLPQVVTVGRP